MKRKLLLVNLALAALSVAGGVHLRRAWIDARAREQAVLRKRIRPVPAPPVYTPPAAEPVKAAGYSDIAQKMLFSKDRNPVVVVAPPPPPKPVPMPPLPLFHGVLDVGDGPIAIMSLGPKGPHRDYQPGDEVGPFKLVAVNNEELVLEWQGQTIKKKVDEFLDRSAARQRQRDRLRLIQRLPRRPYRKRLPSRAEISAAVSRHASRGITRRPGPSRMACAKCSRSPHSVRGAFGSRRNKAARSQSGNQKEQSRNENSSSMHVYVVRRPGGHGAG